MSDWTAGIEQILNNPDMMKQVMDLASAIQLEAPESSISMDPKDLAETITKTVGLVQKNEQKQQALVHALLPYLRPGRQTKLQRAMEVARLSQIANAALRSNRIFSGSKEASDHV